MYQVSIRKVGHQEYRAAPRGSGLVYEIREGGWTSGRPGERVYSIDRVESDGTRTAIAGPYVYSDVPSTLRECEHRIWMDLPADVKWPEVTA